MKRNEILGEAEIAYFKANKNEITGELLASLRAQGNEGKRIALEILDTPKDNMMFYLDAFGQKISYNSNKQLKKVGTVMGLSPIHLEEIEKCTNDFNYFRENYVTIKTKKGIDFPEMREYQQRFIDAILDDDNEEVVGLMGRQCISGDTILETSEGNKSISQLFAEN